MPHSLHVSAARAPQFRFGHVPPPDPEDDALIDELRRLGGAPPDVLDNPDLMRIALPALRADTGLYRRYVYQPEEPLNVSIFAYAGRGDANIQEHHIQGWREQTTANFNARWFPGGHFYLQTDAEAFLNTLRENLKA
jgi:surfactin synthase thioesterase subunit